MGGGGGGVAVALEWRFVDLDVMGLRVLYSATWSSVRKTCMVVEDPVVQSLKSPLFYHYLMVRESRFVSRRVVACGEIKSNQSISKSALHSSCIIL